MDIFTLHGFDNTIWLLIWVVFVCVALFFLFYKKQRNNFLQADLLAQVYGKNSLWYKLYVSLLFIISILFFIIIAGPYKNDSIEKVQKNGIDIEIVFDVSYSMIATDIRPSRIDVARRVFSGFISELKSDRVGLILFSGKPFQSVPLSHDYNFLSDFISSLSVDIINQQNPQLQGTAIWDWLVLASDVLWKDAPEREKVIILITDGEANKWVEPELALKLLKQKNIKTYTIGVGKNERSSINVPLWWWLVRQVLISWVDEEILKKISSETWGKYFRADSESALRDILDEIQALEKTQLEFESINFHASNAGIFLALLLLCFTLLSYIVFFKKVRI